MRQTLKTSSHWSGDDGQCMNPGCAVDTCDDQELPDFLRGKTSTFVLQSTTGGFSVEDLEREQQREQHQDQNVYLVSQKMCQQRNCLNKMVLSKASLFLFVEYICETFDCSSFFQSRWWFPGWEPTFQEYSAEAWPWTGQMGPRQRWLPMLKMAKNREYFCQKVRQFLHLKVTIGTHNGSFHCDESLACSLLKLLPQYANARVVRTRWRSSFECKIYSPIIILNLKQFIIFLPFRDPAVLDTCTLVVDVGGEFNREKHRYDHHQKTFSETLNSLDSKKKWVTKLKFLLNINYYSLLRSVL